MKAFRGSLNQETVRQCRQKLLQFKQDVLNRIRGAANQYSLSQASRSTTGDEIDQAVTQLEEHSFLVAQDRMRNQLIEVELALARIENGTFGVCEETEEPIEVERLIAIPWTRLSIEGAEIRESLSHRFAR